MRRDRGERGKNKNCGPGSRSTLLLVLNQLRGSHSWCHAMVFGGRPDALPPPGGWRWLLRSRAAGSQSAVPCSTPDMAECSRLRPPGERRRLLRSLSDGQPPHLDPGAQQRALHTTCSSITPAPPPRAATGSLRFFLLPDLLSTAIPLSSEGCLTACPSFLPGFGTNVIQFVDMGRRRREPVNN